MNNNNLQLSDNYMRNNAEQPLRKILTKIVPVGFELQMKDDETDEKVIKQPIEELINYVPVVQSDASVVISDIRHDDTPMTPYDLAIKDHLQFDSIVKGNIECILERMKDENVSNIKKTLEEFKEQLHSFSDRALDSIQIYLSNSINKLTTAAIMDIMGKIYKKYPNNMRKSISENFAKVLFNTHLSASIFVEIPQRIMPKYNHRLYTIDTSLYLNDIIYTLDNSDEVMHVDHFIAIAIQKISFAAERKTSYLYDLLFRALSYTAMTIQGDNENIDYNWVTDIMDNICLDTLASFHDSYIDILKFSLLKLNSIYYNIGNYQDGTKQMLKLFRDHNKSLGLYRNDYDEYYDD